MRILFLLLSLINSAWCMDPHEEASFKDSRAALRKKQLSRYLKPPLNTTWDDFKVAELGIAVDDNLKRTLTECYKNKSWRLRPSISKKPTDMGPPAVPAAKKIKKEVLLDCKAPEDEEEKTDSECASISAGDSPVASTFDQNAIKIGMSYLLSRFKNEDYAIRIEIAFCLKAICNLDKINHPDERGSCLRLAKVFNNLADELGRTPSGGQKGYIQNITEMYLRVLIRRSGEYPSEGECEERLNAILSEHVKRLAKDLVFSNKETYLKELIG